MLITTRGIVFRTIKYGETSLIADIYTEAKGLHSYIISGVRKSKSRTGAGIFQPGSLLDMVAYHRDDKKLLRIKEAKSAFPFRQIPFKLSKTAVLVFMAELAQKSIKESEPNTAVFGFLWHNVCLLDEIQTPIANLPIGFMSQLARELGFGPQLPDGKTPVFDLKEGIFRKATNETEYIEEGIIILTLKEFFKYPLSDIHQIPTTKKQRKECLTVLTKYYQMHVEGFHKLNSPEIYEAVF